MNDDINERVIDMSQHGEIKMLDFNNSSPSSINPFAIGNKTNLMVADLVDQDGYVKSFDEVSLATGITLDDYHRCIEIIKQFKSYISGRNT